MPNFQITNDLKKNRKNLAKALYELSLTQVGTLSQQDVRNNKTFIKNLILKFASTNTLGDIVTLVIDEKSGKPENILKYYVENCEYDDEFFDIILFTLNTQKSAIQQIQPEKSELKHTDQAEINRHQLSKGLYLSLLGKKDAVNILRALVSKEYLLTDRIDRANALAVAMDRGQLSVAKYLVEDLKADLSQADSFSTLKSERAFFEKIDKIFESFLNRGCDTNDIYQLFLSLKKKIIPNCDLRENADVKEQKHDIHCLHFDAALKGGLDQGSTSFRNLLKYEISKTGLNPDIKPLLFRLVEHTTPAQFKLILNEMFNLIATVYEQTSLYECLSGKLPQMQHITDLAEKQEILLTYLKQHVTENSKCPLFWKQYFEQQLIKILKNSDTSNSIVLEMLLTDKDLSKLSKPVIRSAFDSKDVHENIRVMANILGLLTPKSDASLLDSKRLKNLKMKFLNTLSLLKDPRLVRLLPEQIVANYLAGEAKFQSLQSCMDNTKIDATYSKRSSSKSLLEIIVDKYISNLQMNTNPEDSKKDAAIASRSIKAFQYLIESTSVSPTRLRSKALPNALYSMLVSVRDNNLPITDTIAKMAWLCMKNGVILKGEDDLFLQHQAFGHKVLTRVLEHLKNNSPEDVAQFNKYVSENYAFCTLQYHMTSRINLASNSRTESKKMMEMAKWIKPDVIQPTESDLEAAISTGDVPMLRLVLNKLSDMEQLDLNGHYSKYIGLAKTHRYHVIKTLMAHKLDIASYLKSIRSKKEQTELFIGLYSTLPKSADCDVAADNVLSERKKLIDDFSRGGFSIITQSQNQQLDIGTRKALLEILKDNIFQCDIDHKEFSTLLNERDPVVLLNLMKSASISFDKKDDEEAIFNAIYEGCRLSADSKNTKYDPINQYLQTGKMPTSFLRKLLDHNLQNKTTNAHPIRDTTPWVLAKNFINFMFYPHTFSKHNMKVFFRVVRKIINTIQQGEYLAEGGAILKTTDLQHIMKNVKATMKGARFANSHYFFREMTKLSTAFKKPEEAINAILILKSVIDAAKALATEDISALIYQKRTDKSYFNRLFGAKKVNIDQVLKEFEDDKYYTEFFAIEGQLNTISTQLGFIHRHTADVEKIKLQNNDTSIKSAIPSAPIPTEDQLAVETAVEQHPHSVTVVDVDEKDVAYQQKFVAVDKDVELVVEPTAQPIITVQPHIQKTLDFTNFEQKYEGYLNLPEREEQREAEIARAKAEDERLAKQQKELAAKREQLAAQQVALERAEKLREEQAAEDKRRREAEIAKTHREKQAARAQKIREDARIRHQRKLRKQLENVQRMKAAMRERTVAPEKTDQKARNNHDVTGLRQLFATVQPVVRKVDPVVRKRDDAKRQSESNKSKIAPRNLRLTRI